ncbi:MAG: helix-turn-helix domain-containing protein [Saccharofermentanales bacterium]
MLANYENRLDKQKEKVWVGKYRNLHNLPHWHLECELIYIDKGAASISISHQTYDVTVGQCLFCGSGEVHHIRGDADSIISVFLFDAALAREILDQYQLADALLKSVYGIGSVFAAVQSEIDNGELFYETRVHAAISDLIAAIFRKEERVRISKAPADSGIARYKSLLEEIDARYCFCTFDEAAEFMGLSRSYFSKYFHRISGMTFSRYLNTVRVEKSIEMLSGRNSALAVTQVAAACGFDTIRHFNRVFRQITGTTPKRMPGSYVLSKHRMIPVRDTFNPTLSMSEQIIDS